MWDQHYNLYLDPSWSQLPICCSNDPCQLPAAAAVLVQRGGDGGKTELSVLDPDLGLLPALSLSQGGEGGERDDEMIR